MALFNRVTTWVSNQVLTASALNGEFNNILNNAQASSWIGFSSNVAQMQQQTTPGGVGSESLAGSISDELQRLRWMLAYTLGKTFWYDQTGRNLGTGNLAVDTADIVNNAVTAAKIPDGSITRPKLVSVGQQVSASSGTFGTTSATFVDVTNLSVTITTTGRPVIFGLISDGDPANSSIFGVSISGALTSGQWVLYDVTAGAIVAGNQIDCVATSAPSGTLRTSPTMPGFFHIEAPAAGTRTYKVRVAVYGGGTFQVYRMKLVAYEL